MSPVRLAERRPVPPVVEERPPPLLNPVLVTAGLAVLIALVWVLTWTSVL